MFLFGRGGPVREPDSLTPSVSRVYRQCGILNISQLCTAPQPVTGIASYSVSCKTASVV
jgi:hypothetical protein